MTQLIITVFSIALVALLSVAAINYIPHWQGPARDVERKVRLALPQLEQAYDVVTRANGGVPPAVLAQADGGFATQFLSTLKFAPVAPAGYTWVYGQHSDDGSRYANLNYFCLAPTQGTPEVVGKGLYRGVATFSPEQAFVGATCGATASAGQPAQYAGSTSRAVTFFVAYTPGITR